MKQKLIYGIGLSTISCCVLFAANIETIKDFSKYPLSQKTTGISRGGNITDIQSAKDGIGTIVIGGIAADTNKISNKEYSKLIQQKLSELETTNNLKDSDLTDVDFSKLNNNGNHSPTH